MGTDDSTAIAAVVIAVIAFFVTTAQLLQALFGTAEGFRKCQSSVIGRWATKTKRNFRWSELRFETIFSVPDIRLQRGRYEDSEATPLFGDLESRIATMTPSLDSLIGGRGDLVSWLLLLEQLQVLQDLQRKWADDLSTLTYSADIRPPLHQLIWPQISFATITIRTRSWDFMPPDIVRPYASSTVGDIIAIAHRLGMEWTDLRPADSIMRAEGNGQSISSTSVRSLGMLLQYTNDRPSANGKVVNDPSIMVCSDKSDKFAFGIIPGCRALQISDVVLNDAPEMTAIKNVMQGLGIGEYEHHLKDEANIRAFLEIVPLMAQWIPLPGSSVVQICRPCRNAGSALSWWEGFITFHHRLRDICTDKDEEKASTRMRWILEKFEMLRTKYPWNKVPSWEDESNNNNVKNGRDRGYLDDLHKIWQDCTLYLRDLMMLKELEKPSLSYQDLVAAHIAMAVTCPIEAVKTVGKGTDKNARWWNGAVRSHHMAETMHLYIDKIPTVADFMVRRGFDDRDTVRDAWWTMMLRAMCWQRSVAFVNRRLAPSSLYDSRVPVYIA